MAERLVVADASPLIGLARAEGFAVLRGVFRRVTVTVSVRDEVLARPDRPGAPELDRAIRDGWVRIEPDPPDALEFAGLGPGEATTLAFAFAHRGPSLVLMDETQGRAYARKHGLDVIGVAGVLLEAKNVGLVDEVRPYFDRLRKSGFRLSGKIVHRMLARAGEAVPQA